jgi:hypothetical protein
MRVCWLFYGDAWGFADLARRRQDDALKSLRLALAAVKKLREAHPTVEYFLFSDTIVCLRELPEDKEAEGKDVGFAELLLAVQFLVTELLEAGLLLRGVVTFGNLHREGDNEVVIGEALLDAAEFERTSVAPPLVFLPIATLVRGRNAGRCSETLYKNNLKRSILIRTKDGGIIRAQPILGDKPKKLSQHLERAFEAATTTENYAARTAGALQDALDIVTRVANSGRAQS